MQLVRLAASRTAWTAGSKTVAENEDDDEDDDHT